MKLMRGVVTMRKLGLIITLTAILLTQCTPTLTRTPAPPIDEAGAGGSVPDTYGTDASGAFTTNVPTEAPPFHELGLDLALTYNSNGGVCREECQEDYESCLADAGAPGALTKAQCRQEFNACTATCSTPPTPTPTPTPTTSPGANTPASSSAGYPMDSFGAFTTGVPIEVPAFHGIEPALSLSYNSRGGDGWLGIDWRLDGLWSIQRASPGKGVPRFDSSDIFLLNGVELHPCPPDSQPASSPSCTSARAAFGSSNGFYYAHTENFQRIQFNSDPNVNEWYIWAKNGAKVTYQENQHTSRGTVRWTPSTVVDTHRNHVDYAYWCDGENNSNECYLDRISYNHIGPLQFPGTTIKFYSEPRDVRPYGNGDSIVNMRYRLKTIDVLRGLNDGTYRRVRAYVLGYTIGPNGIGSLFNAIDQYGGDAVVNCGLAVGDSCDPRQATGIVTFGTRLPVSLEFEYDQTAPSFTQVGAQSPPSWCSTANQCLSRLPNHVIHGDFNGDGRTDFMSANGRTASMSPYSDNGQFNTWLSNGDGTFTWVAASQIPSWCKDPSGSGAVVALVCVSRAWQDNMVGDFNGDGKTDFVSAFDNFETFLSNGDGTFRWAGSTPPPLECAPASQCLTPQDGAVIVGDFNGDGKTDFMSPFVEYDERGNIKPDPDTTTGIRKDKFRTWLSNDDGTFRLVDTTPLPDWCARPSGCLNRETNHILVGDFNGDGLTDFLTAGKDFETFFSNGDGTFRTAKMSPPSWCKASINSSSSFATYCLNRIRNAVVTGDFNGDGLTDFMSANGKRGFDTFLSNGDGTFSWVSTSTLPQFCNVGAYDCLSHDLNDVVIGDFNGDGKTDFMSANRSFDTWLSKGDGTFIYTGASDPPSWCPYAGDCVDSTEDSVSKDTAGFVVVGDFNGDGKDEFLSANDTFDVWQADVGPSFRMTKATNNLGGVTTISYTPSTDWSNSYLPSGMILSTVASVTVSDGRGTSETTAFDYGGGLWSDSERSFLGFGQVDVTDAVENLASTTYLQSANCAGQPKESVVRDPLKHPYAKTTWTYSGNTSPPYTCFPKSQQHYECNGSDTACRITASDQTWNEYGEVKELLEYGRVNSTTDDRYTLLDFKPNLASYIVDRPASESVYVWNGATTGPMISRVRFVYDFNADETLPPAEGDLTKVLTWNDRTGLYEETSYMYDATGNQIRSRDASGYEQVIEYDPIYHLYPTRIGSCLLGTTNCSQYSTSTQWNPILGVPISSTDMNDATTQISYDALGRPTVTTLPDGGSVTTSYLDIGSPANGQRIRETVDDGSPDGLWTETYLDGLGRPYTEIRKGGFTQQTAYSYASRQPWKSSNWYVDGETPQETSYRYDALNRLVKVVHPDATFTQTTFDQNADEVFVTTYDELGHQRQTTLDGYGRIAAIREFNASTTADTNYEYDILGRLIQVTDAAGNISTINWDSLGRKIKSCDPDMGCWTYTYLPNGFLDTQTDAKDQKIRMTYDAIGRLSTKDELDAAGNILRQSKWTYDADAQGKPHGASLGRLVSVEDSSGSESFWYDNMGRKVQTHKCVTGVCYDMKSTYDKVGRLETLVYPNSPASVSDIVTYKYDEFGRLASAVPYVASMTYYSNGALKTIQYGNNTSTSYSYDPRREWLTNVAVSDPQSNPLFSASYSYDSDGLITGMEVANPQTSTFQYTYDDLHRLTNVQNAQQPNLNQDLHYDAIGNIIYNSLIGDYSYPPSGPNGCGTGIPCKGPHAVLTAGNNSYAYDANGNMISGGGRAIPDWDYNNLPLTIQVGSQTTQYMYDAFGNRVQKVAPNVKTTRYFGKFLEQGPGGGLAKYYYAGGMLIARRDENANLLYYHADHLGSPRLLTDQAGKVVKRYDYSAFGIETDLTPGTQIDEPTGFTGAVNDAETGLIYMGARYYDPSLARFISADSIVPSAINPQTLNRYSYVYNNPISFIDPTGHVMRDYRLFFPYKAQDSDEFESPSESEDGAPEEDFADEWVPAPEAYSDQWETLTPPPLVDARTGLPIAIIKGSVQQAIEQGTIPLKYISDELVVCVADCTLGNAMDLGLISETKPERYGTDYADDVVAIGRVIANTAEAVAVYAGPAQAAASAAQADLALLADQARANTLAKVVTPEGTLRVSETVAGQLAEERSYIPAQAILDAIRTGSRVPDPQGVAGQFMYTLPVQNGYLEVLVHETIGEIRHVMYVNPFK